METKIFTVDAKWDKEAGVWVAESEGIPGLITEAASPESLIEKLKVLIPELLELNDALPIGSKCIDLAVHYHREDRATFPVAA